MSRMISESLHVVARAIARAGEESRVREQFEAHLASKHITAMLEVVLPLPAEPPDIRKYRRLSAPA